MKKALFLVLALLIALLPLSALAEEVQTIVIGATPTPHSELLELVAPKLLEEGIKLEIRIFTDYPLPNPALAAGELDANYFQHGPYLDAYNETVPDSEKLVPAIGVHYEPYALYPGKTKTLEELKDGATITVTNDPSNEARALLLLEEAGLITLREGAGLTATILDIEENPRSLNIMEIDAAQLPRTLADVDFAVINGNFALDAGLSPARDAVFMESSESEAGKTYTNYVVVRPEDAESEWVAKLREALCSEEVREFMLSKEEYKGGVIPAF